MTAADRGGRQTPAWLLPVGVWLLGVLVFFRGPVFSGFDTITGDEGDARLVVYLHEHWWQVLQGDHGWRDPPVFFPTENVLSYSDTFVLNQLLYVPLRIVGVEPFVAFQICLMALTAIAFAATYVLLRRHLDLPVLVASLLAATVAFANNLYIDTPHAQLFSVCVVPLILLLGVEAWKASGRRANVLGIAAGSLLGLLLWSNFYFGWFAVVVALIAAVVAAALVLATGHAGDVARAISSRWPRLLAAAGGVLVMLVPFLLTYSPALADDRSRSYDEVAGLAPRPFDMINAGRDNVVWGWLMRSLSDDEARLEQLNRATALTPLLLMATIAGGVWLTAVWRRRGATPAVVAGVTASMTALIVVVLPVQFGFGGAWSWLHRLFPGGSAIRVYARIEVVNVLVAVLAVACAISGLRRVTVSNRVAVMTLTVGLPLLIAVEQLNTTDNFRELDRSEQLAMLDAVPDPPQECDVLWIVPAPGRNPDHASIDAMLIAQRTGRATVNGYSGWTPDGWNLQPGADGYEQAVAGWLDEHSLTSAACAFDAASRSWRRG